MLIFKTKIFKQITIINKNNPKANNKPWKAGVTDSENIFAEIKAPKVLNPEFNIPQNPESKAFTYC